MIQPVPNGFSLSQVLSGGSTASGYLSGAAFGRYLIDAELGRGAVGVVYRALDRQLGSIVALKILRTGAFADRTARERFLREAKLGSRYEHPGVVRTLDVGEIDGLLYLTQELVPGGTLRQVIEDGLSPERAVELLVGIADALAPGHSRGVIHRDLKPDNVLMREDGSPAVADLGLARNLNLASSLTKTGAMVGTPNYMAPEQIKGKELTAAADVFALGTMLYEALTGTLPFRGGNLALRYAAIHASPPASPAELAPEVPGEVAAVCLRALAASPEDRYPDAGAFAAALRAAQRGDGAGLLRRHLPTVGPPLGASFVAVAMVLTTAAWTAPAPSSAERSLPGTAADVDASKRDLAGELAAIAEPAARLERARQALSAEPGQAAALAVVRELTPWVRREDWGVPEGRDGFRGTFLYHPGLKKLLMFGGWSGTYASASNQLWTYDGSVWSEVEVEGNLPPARFASAAAYDSRRDRLVVFAGLGPKRLRDVWEWDGVRWEQRPFTKGPKARAWHSMVYAPDRGEVLLFGGSVEGNKDAKDLWAWNGEAWTNLQAKGLEPRSAMGMTYFGERGPLLLFGGTSGSKHRPAELWNWSGGAWKLLKPGGLRPAGYRQAPAMVQAGKRTYVFGGSEMTDTWSFDGDAWTRHAPLVSPPSVQWQALGYDPGRRVLVLAGGTAKKGRVKTVWEYPLPPEVESP